jgi:predicted Zn-dependent peptidase
MASPRQNREIVREVLPNGIRVITEHMPHVRSVSVGVWIATGSREEAERETGISHFIEHMLFKGTRKRSAEQIARAADCIGGGLDAFTSKEVVSYNIKVLDEHLPQAFDIVADLVRNPLFDRNDIEKEKGVVLEELKMEADNPEYQLHELFSKHFWKGHALGRSILGTQQTIRGFSRDAVERYYHQVYAPTNIVVTAAGNLEHRRLAHLAAKYLGDMQARPFTPAAVVPQPHAPLVFRDKKNLEQVHLYLGVPSIPMPHESRFACYLLNAILGGGMSSRLFQNIREKQGLAYSIYSELSLYRDAGCMLIYAGTSTRNAAKVIDSIVNEMHEVAAQPACAEELRRAKDHLKGSLVLSLESTSSRMANLARQETYFHRFLSIDEMLERIESVTAAEVQGLAQEFFHPEQVALAMLGPLGGFRVRRQDLVR